MTKYPFTALIVTATVVLAIASAGFIAWVAQPKAPDVSQCATYTVQQGYLWCVKTDGKHTAVTKVAQ